MMHTRNHRPRIRSEKPFRTEKNHLDVMTEESIEQFLVFQQEERYSPETLKIHRRILHYPYDFLPEGKKFYKDALAEWRETLKTHEYAISTINSFIHIANKYMEFVGRRDYQILSRLKDDSKSESSELTREEYLQLLRTARKQGKKYLYLAIKMVGSTGCTMTELVDLAVEDVRESKMFVFRNGERKYIRLPGGLRQELLNYAARCDISSGRIFQKGEGAITKRAQVTPYITRLCTAAGIPEGKGNVSCIQEMYRAMRIRIENGISPSVEQRHRSLIEQEQTEISWKEAQ